MDTTRSETGSKLQFLDGSELERVHAASIALLSDPGVQCDSPTILDTFAKAGAAVDRDRRVVRIGSDFVQAAFETVPKSFTLYGRAPGRELRIEAGRTYFGMGGASEPLFWDYDIAGPRKPTKEDMIRCTRLGQQLKHMDFVMALCSAGDQPKAEIFLHEYDALFRNTDKPIVYSAPGRFHAAAFVQMAAAACGGESALRERPCVAGLVTPSAPLHAGRLDESLYEFAAAGVPALIRPGPMMGATGPATVAGVLAQTNAEALFILVLSQLVQPGMAVIYGPATPAMDMTTTLCTYGSPDEALGRALVAQLSTYYGLPSWNTAATESKLPDAAAAGEAMMGMLLNALAGMTMTQALGTLASGYYGAPEMAVICDEMAAMIRYVVGGAAVTDETLAVDVMREIGHAGNFLANEHTARLFRQQLYFPGLFKRQTIDQWQAGGKPSVLETAHQQVQDILAQAGPLDLPPGADAALERVLSQALRDVHRQPVA